MKFMLPTGKDRRALHIELVNLDDPVQIGAVTFCEIRVANTAAWTETGLQLICTIRDAKGPNNSRFTLEGKEVVFEPLPKLATRADAFYRVSVRPTGSGEFRFRATVNANDLVCRSSRKR